MNSDYNAYNILYHDVLVHIDNKNRMSSTICMIVDKPGSFVMSIYNTLSDVCKEYESDSYDDLYNDWLGIKNNANAL